MAPIDVTRLRALEADLQLAGFNGSTGQAAFLAWIAARGGKPGLDHFRAWCTEAPHVPGAQLRHLEANRTFDQVSELVGMLPALIDLAIRHRVLFEAAARGCRFRQVYRDGVPEIEISDPDPTVGWSMSPLPETVRAIGGPPLELGALRAGRGIEKIVAARPSARGLELEVVLDEEGRSLMAATERVRPDVCVAFIPGARP